MGFISKMLTWLLLLAGAAAAIAYTFFCDVWVIPDDDPALAASIAPTLGPGDVVVLERRPSASRGHLLRCVNPETPDRFMIGRAIGMGGDLLDVTGEIVKIDGHRTPSPRACDPAQVTVHDPVTDEDVPLHSAVEEYGDHEFCTLRSMHSPEAPLQVQVENGKVFLLSDNRHIHADSRDVGGAVLPSTCQHILYRLVGPGGWSDDTRRLTVIW
jgi:hypothetical protein